MKELYRRKFRTTSARLSTWDYGSSGKYFVTICTFEKKPFFGTIINGCLQATQIGLFAQQCWHSIPQYYPFVILDEFVIMPDHLHGILSIAKKDDQKWQANQFGPQKDNLPAVIRGYKMAVTGLARSSSIDFKWQPRYYDRVIRYSKELNQIREYIINNPSR